MPKMSVISMLANHLCRRLMDFFWLDALHDQHGPRVLLKRQHVFMRMQRQQSQWQALSSRDGTRDSSW
jgi:hypothetical protein